MDDGTKSETVMISPDGNPRSFSRDGMPIARSLGTDVSALVFKAQELKQALGHYGHMTTPGPVAKVHAALDELLTSLV